MPEIRKEILLAYSRRGLDYPESFPLRFLPAVLAARDTGALVVLAGSTGTGKTQIVRQTARTFAGVGSRAIPVRPEWLGATDLLGFVDPIRSVYVPTPFVDAVREATAAMEEAPEGVRPPPFLVLLDEMNLARIENFGADLLSVLELPSGPERVLGLFSESQALVWRLELQHLRDHEGELDPDTSHRLDALDFLLDGETPHLLEVPPNLVLCGTLNTDRHTEPLSPKVLDRSFVLQAPDPSLDDLFAETLLSTGDAPVPLSLPKASLEDSDTPWKRLPQAHKVFRAALEALVPSGVRGSRRMTRNAARFLHHASAFYDVADPTQQSLLAASLVHMLLLPRIECRPTDAIQPLQALADLLEAHLPKDHDVLREVHTLQEQAAAGGHGVLRGLR